MPSIAHTLPFMLLQQSDLNMAEECFGSLSATNCGGILVLYNQGALTNQQLNPILDKYPLEYVVLGEGRNIGIPAARQACFRYIWENLPGVEYITEIHVDMMFPSGWMETLTDWLEANDEPMISPGILTAFGELHPELKGIRSMDIPADYASILALLPNLTSEATIEGFVHPVMHRSEALKSIGGYDTRFLTGQQGYEDDSLLLGYRYYMGTRKNWKPKACLRTRVFHQSLAQRIFIPNIQEECNRNLEGLIKQYGIHGLLQLSEIHGNGTFEQIALNRISSGQIV